jgi:hypothetical protein
LSHGGEGIVQIIVFEKEYGVGVESFAAPETAIESEMGHG